uniref:Neck appendage protein n=1 Tax=Siphoviridae sp. ctLAG1 TaxID=2826248 RepID=A0A8S5MGT9_9CAUD|nr:MAG TPA: Neck appendage protein [Siphoviridae sp. ctLAG1]
MNGDFTLTVKYPISDSGIYQLIQEDMLIKAPTPVLGAQLFRIKKPVEHNDHLEITAHHISDDVMQRSITPVSVTSQSCGMALSRMVQNTKTALGDFSFNSDIQDRRTFNTTETETLYSVLLDGKHSIVGTWEGELVRDNFAMTVKKNRGENRGVVITTHKNLKDYQRTKNSQNVVTRIHAKSTFKPEGAEKETTIRVTVDSPLINSYPYINEKEYENNNAKTVEELQKWAQAKFTNQGIDKVFDAIKIEAYELDGQVVHMGDTVNLKSWKHNVDVFKKAVAYEFDALKEEYISLTFDDKAGTGGSRVSGGLSSAADAILGVTESVQEVALEKALQNADLDFEHKVGLLRQEIADGVELAKARAEEVKRKLSDTIDQRFSSFDNGRLQEVKRRADDALKNAGAGGLLAQEAKQISEQLRRQLDNKADLIEFQRVKETNQLYERIIGSSESDIAEKVSRMAMTSQLFQVEVAKNVGDGRNYVRNADFRDKSKNWRETNVSGLNFNYEHSSQNRNKSGVHIYGTTINARYFGLQQTFKIELKKSDKITLSFLISKDGYNTFSGINVGLHYRKDGAIKSQAWKEIPNGDITSSIYKKLIFNYELPVDVDEINLMLYGQQGKSINLYISEIKLETGNNATSFTLAPEDTDEAVRTVQNQLAGSWAIQNLTSAGSIISQINATNNQILIEAEKIRLKGKTLLDELTAIDGYFKRLFVGEGNFAKLNAEIIGANTITADKLVMDQAMARMFVSSDIFTDTLASKTAFINKLRSVVVSATLFEGFKGRIGGFQIGTHDKDPSAYWLTGQSQFSVGMSSGSNNTNWTRTALWVNWGDNWESPGNDAWFVRQNGRMFCYSRAEFWDTPIIHGNLQVTGNIYYAKESGLWAYWISSPEYSSIAPSNNYLYLYRANSSYDWIPMNKEISDRRYKHNIEDSTVSGLDIIEQLKTYSYRKEYDGKIEDISCGIMAQDVQKYVPEAFYENPDGAYSYRTFELVPYLIKAIQELNQKIHKLEKKHDRTGQTNQRPDN